MLTSLIEILNSSKEDGRTLLQITYASVAIPTE